MSNEPSDSEDATDLAADGPWLEGPLPIATAGETYEQFLERRVEVMRRMARDENLRLHFAKRLS